MWWSGYGQNCNGVGTEWLQVGSEQAESGTGLGQGRAGARRKKCRQGWAGQSAVGPDG